MDCGLAGKDNDEWSGADPVAIGSPGRRLWAPGGADTVIVREGRIGYDVKPEIVGIHGVGCTVDAGPTGHGHEPYTGGTTGNLRILL